MSKEKLKLEDLLGDIHHDNEEGRIEDVAIIGAGVMGQGIAHSDFCCRIRCSDN
jgi:hypothetical protein